MGSRSGWGRAHVRKFLGRAFLLLLQTVGLLSLPFKSLLPRPPSRSPFRCPPTARGCALAAGGLLRTFASCSSGSREQRVPPDMKLSAMVSGETPRRRISLTHCSCNIWSYESGGRLTLGVSRIFKQMQQQRQPNDNDSSAPGTFELLNEVLSAWSTVPYHCHPRMRGSHRTQASD